MTESIAINPLISIIVPFYNQEQYLERCINSILNQTYKNLQIILIDDGSTDSSFSICENYKLSDNRIILIKQNNQGVSSARNKGLSLATGDFITFVDGDDWIDINTYEKAIHCYKTTNADVICWGVKCIKDNKVVLIQNRATSLFSQNPILELSEIPNYRSIWNKLIKKEIALRNSFMENIFFGEDTLYLIDCLLSSTSLYIIGDFVPYNYFQNENSCMANIDSKLRDNMLLCNELIFQRLNNYSNPKIQKIINEIKLQSKLRSLLHYLDIQYSRKLYLETKWTFFKYTPFYHWPFLFCLNLHFDKLLMFLLRLRLFIKSKKNNHF